MTKLALELSLASKPARGPGGPPVATIVLSANTIAEDAALGAAVGTLSVINATGTPSFTLVDSAGSRFALSGANVQRGATALDYETATSHNIIVSVTGMTPSPSNATLTINVTDVVEATYQAESEVIFAAMTGLTDPRKTVIDTLVAALKTAGVWTKLDFLHVYAAHNSGASLVNWKNPGTWNATAVNSPTFTVDRGYTGNGTSSYLNANYNASTAGGVLTLNSAHAGVWARSNEVQSATDIGTYAGPPGLAIQGSYAGAFYTAPNCALTGSTYDVAARHMITTRDNSADFDTFKNGAGKETKVIASTSIPNFSTFVCALNFAGGANQFSTKQYAAAHQGSDLSDANVSAFYTALSTYMTAVGA